MNSPLELSEEERELLAETVDSALTHLDVETHRTDTLEYKQSLQHRSDILRELLAKLTRQTTPIRG